VFDVFDMQQHITAPTQCTSHVALSTVLASFYGLPLRINEFTSILLGSFLITAFESAVDRFVIYRSSTHARRPLLSYYSYAVYFFYTYSRGIALGNSKSPEFFSVNF